MRIGIVGGGGAGLAAAWLLESEHDVTLFEQDDRLGGHAATVDVKLASGTVPVDVGAEFLSPRLHPTTLRLMRLAGVATHDCPLTVTLYSPPRAEALILPPFRHGRPAGSAFRPRTLAHLITLQRFFRRAPADVGLESGAFTIEEALDAARASQGFRERLFYPLALSGWCVDMDDFRTFSAYNILRYFAAGAGPSLSPPRWLDVAGGMRTYVEAVAGMLQRTQVRLAAPVAGLARAGEGFHIHPAGPAAPVDVDAVILATNAAQAQALLSGVPEAGELRRVLASVPYTTTRIAIHGDPRLMPPRKRDWSVVNTRFDGAHSQNTVWKPWRQPAEGHVFKSWVTYDAVAPDPLHALLSFEHAMINRAYFEAQRALATLQGRGGVWVAGVYTTDIDSHESAIRSAVAIAQRLAPGAERLRTLLA